MKLNLIVSYEWQNPQATWSGIPFALEKVFLRKKALNKKINTGINCPEFIFCRILEKTIFRHGYFQVKRCLQDHKAAIIVEPNEYNLYISGCHIRKPQPHSWFYLDLTVQTLLLFKDTDPVSFEKSTFEKIREKELLNWNQQQLSSFENIKGIFTMSHWLENLLRNQLHVPCEVVYAGGGYNIDLAKRNHRLKTGNKILFVGRDFERKGGLLVLDAFRLLRQMRPDTELYIAGGFVLTKPEKNVHCLGNLDLEEIASYFNLCDVFCMPSYFEAWGIVFAEALLFGLPCIGRNKFEMPYLIEDKKSGFLIEDNTPPLTLAKMLLELLTNPQYRTYVNSNFEKYKALYSWDKVADNIINAMYLKRK